jgi:UDP-N-acetyl-2-amino-2-deoxyglucuronate dehydrogenase
VLEGDHFSGTTAEPAENASSPVVTDVSAHVRIVEDFVDAIQSGRPPICDGAEGRRSVELVEAIYRSAREQRPIDLSRG